MSHDKHTHQHHFAQPAAAARIEIEGELSSGIAGQAIGFCAARFAERDRTVERVIEFGSGPSVDTGRLAARFSTARLLVTDSSPVMLARAEERAVRLGVANRLSTRVLDLDDEFRLGESYDLAWSAMAIHHVKDEVATLIRIREALTPDGLLCVLERADPMAIRMAQHGGRPGLWDRIEAAALAWFDSARSRMAGATKAEHYPEMLAAAGFDVLEAQMLTDTVTPAQDGATREFLANHLQALARNLVDHADPADLDALTAIADSGSWSDNAVTVSREVFVATPTGARS